MTQVSTDIARNLSAAKKTASYDKAAKLLLSNKDILANILKECVSEFQEFDRNFIRDKCLLDGVSVDKYSVDWDAPDDDSNGAESITGLNPEDNTILEGKRNFDLLFEAQVPLTENNRRRRKKAKGHQDAAASGKEDAASSDEPEKIVLMFNLEVQQDTSPDYPLINRAIFYICRMIGRQQRMIKDFDYSKMRKVYSIWICPNPKNETSNRIFRYRFHPCQALKEVLKNDETYVDESDDLMKTLLEENQHDLMEIIFIYVANNQLDSPTPVIKMLGNLFSRQKTVDERKKILENEFGIRMTKEDTGRMDEMCNMGQALLDEGIEIGEAKGIKIGEAKGIKIGEAKGKAEGKAEGKIEGIKIARLGSVKNARKELGCTWERAMAVVGIPENEYAEYKEMLNKEGQALT